MTVKELIKFLSEHDKDYEVIINKGDEELILDDTFKCYNLVKEVHLEVK